MQIFGRPEVFEPLQRDGDEDEPALRLTEATLAARPGDLRAIARFLERTADQLEAWGPRFDHEHFWDWVDCYARLRYSHRLAVEETGHEPGRDELAKRAGLTHEIVEELTATDLWQRLIAEPVDATEAAVAALGPLLAPPAKYHRRPDVIVSAPPAPAQRAAVEEYGDWRDSLPPLIRASARGDSGAVAALLRVGCDPNHATDDGWTALHAAALEDHPDVVRQLLQAGAAVDARTKDGYTPLLNAADAGPAVITALLDGGADAMAQERTYGWRPLQRCADYGNAAGVALLLQAGADPDAKDFSGTSVLADAATAGCVECVELLLKAGADARRTWDANSS